MNSQRAVTILISAGEASGDMHGGRLVRELKKRLPDGKFVGIGGKALAEQNVTLLYRAEELGVTGFIEVFKQLPLIRRALRDMKQLILQKPDMLILIDYPDFNFRLAKFAHTHNVPVVYYISPQIWAWRKKRVFKIKKWVSRMLVIIPFEVDFYQHYNVPVTYVGHPLLDQWSEEGFKESKSTSREELICLMPGSRHNELHRLLPEMVKAVQLLHERFPLVRFELLLADTIKEETVIPYLDEVTDIVHIIKEKKRERLSKSRLVITASGTATVEIALSGTPMIVLYRMSAITYHLVKRLIKVPFISMVNLLAKKAVVPELIQSNVKADAIVSEASRMLADSSVWNDIHQQLKGVTALLGTPGASRRAADSIFNLLSSEKQ